MALPTDKAGNTRDVIFERSFGSIPTSCFRT